eukprot:scaffold126482_cov24-Prasinocladus_malaysianus.AAC.1
MQTGSIPLVISAPCYGRGGPALIYKTRFRCCTIYFPVALRSCKSRGYIPGNQRIMLILSAWRKQASRQTGRGRNRQEARFLAYPASILE